MSVAHFEVFCRHCGAPENAKAEIERLKIDLHTSVIRAQKAEDARAALAVERDELRAKLEATDRWKLVAARESHEWKEENGQLRKKLAAAESDVAHTRIILMQALREALPQLPDGDLKWRIGAALDAAYVDKPAT